MGRPGGRPRFAGLPTGFRDSCAAGRCSRCSLPPLPPRPSRRADGSTIATSRVVLAPGHSARELYRTLLARDVAITPKAFAAGFRCACHCCGAAALGTCLAAGPLCCGCLAAWARSGSPLHCSAPALTLTLLASPAAPLPASIEHPQALIDRLQYGASDAAKVQRGKGPIPVAEYRLAAEISAATAAAAAGYPDDWYAPLPLGGSGGAAAGGAADAAAAAAGAAADAGAAAGAGASAGTRGVYSFCMCPGAKGRASVAALGRWLARTGAPRCARRQARPARQRPSLPLALLLLPLQAARSCPPALVRRSCASTA